MQCEHGMKIRHYIITAALVILFIQNLYGQSSLTVAAFFSDSEKKSVLNKEIITRASLSYDIDSGNKKIVIPKSPYSNHDFSEYELLVTEKAFIPYKLTRSSRLKMYNNLTCYSKLSCVSYYSVTEKKVNPFIVKSCRIKSGRERSPVADITDKSIVDKRKCYFQIEDNRFGEMTFESEMCNEGNNFILKNTCIDELSKFGFTVSNSGEYRFIFYFIYDAKAGGYYYYAVQAIRIRSWYIRKLGLVTTESFSNRLRAMTVFYAGQLGQNWDDRLKACE